MHLYVLWCAWSVPWIKRRISLKAYLAIGAILWLIFALGRLYGHDHHGVIASLSEMAAMNWLGIVFLTSVALLGADIIAVCALLLRRRLPALRPLGLTVGLVLSAVALIQGSRPPVVQAYVVRIPALPAAMDETQIAVLSDLHLGTLLGKTWLEARIAQTMALQPDMVLLLGDIFEGHGPPDSALLPALRRLAAPMGVWSIHGNHEFHGDPDGTAAFLQQAGFTVLRNGWVETRHGLILAGVENPTFSRVADEDGQTVARTLGGRPPGATILLSHAPRHYERAASAGVNLMLSGHTHGGQIWPFGYLVQQVFPLYEGRHEVDGMTLIVSRGAGTWGPHMRLWRPSEILRLTLRTGKTDS